MTKAIPMYGRHEAKDADPLAGWMIDESTTVVILRRSGGP